MYLIVVVVIVVVVLVVRNSFFFLLLTSIFCYLPGIGPKPHFILPPQITKDIRKKTKTFLRVTPGGEQKKKNPLAQKRFFLIMLTSIFCNPQGSVTQGFQKDNFFNNPQLVNYSAT